MKLSSFLILPLMLLAPFASAGAGTNRFAVTNLSGFEPGTNISSAQWRPGSSQVTYLRPRSSSNRVGSALCAFDPTTGTETVLYEPPAGTNRGRLSLGGMRWTPRGDAILVNSNSDLWLLPIPGGEPRRLMQSGTKAEFATLSPDGARIAFVRTNNLFVLDLKTGREKQLTRDGSDTILNGRLDWVYEEELSLRGGGRAFEWSPDGRRLVFLRLDQSAVPRHPITDFLQTRPPVRLQRYPKAGDTNSTPSVHVVDVTRSRPRAETLRIDEKFEYVFPEFSWTPDSKAVAVMTMSRGQDELKVWLWDGTRRGRPELLLTESAPAWLNVFDPPHFLARSGAGDTPGSTAARAPASTHPFLWLSERDGWFHLYLYDGRGGVPRQLTRGRWQVEPNQSRSWSKSPFEIDSAGEWIYFSATESDPRERHICRVRIDGTGFERLTREPGTHFQKLSTDGRHLLESFSSVDQPPVIRLLRSDGALVATLDTRVDPWRDFKTGTAEAHEVTAPDGVKLYGRLFKPADFDPARKYPVIVDVYGGPHAQVVRNQWPAASSRNQLLAQEGYLIWSLDNRGSWGRGRAWESAVFKNLGTNELADQLAGVAYLKSLPFVDTNRFGVTGWSYGGYMTLYALTHAPDVFKCGVAGAPVTDWKYYDTIYTERYMRTPKENPVGYKTSSPLAAAKELKARVLVIHGTADDNVHLQNTMSFIDALIQAGCPYELQLQPGQMHGFGGGAATRFLSEQMLDFFRRNL